MKITLSPGELEVRHLGSLDVMAIGQFGRMCIAHGIPRSDLEAVIGADGNYLYALLERVYSKIADPEADFQRIQDHPLWKSYRRLLGTLTGWSSEKVSQLTFDDEFCLFEAILQQEAMTRAGGFLRRMIRDTLAPYIVPFTEVFALLQGLSRMAGSSRGKTSVDDRSTSGSASELLGGMSSGGGTSSSDPSSIGPDGVSITSTNSPSSNSNDSEPAFPALMSSE